MEDDGPEPGPSWRNRPGNRVTTNRDNNTRRVSNDINRNHGRSILEMLRQTSQNRQNYQHVANNVMRQNSQHPQTALRQTSQDRQRVQATNNMLRHSIVPQLPQRPVRQTSQNRQNYQHVANNVLRQNSQHPQTALRQTSQDRQRVQATNNKLKQNNQHPQRPVRQTSQNRQNVRGNTPIRQNNQYRQDLNEDNRPMRQAPQHFHDGNRPMRYNNNPAMQQNPGIRYQNDEPHHGHGDMRGGRGNTRSDRDQKRIRTLGFKTLEEISQAEEKDVLQKLNEKRDGFMNVINSPNKSNLDFYVLLIKILSKVTQSPFVELKSKLILDVCNSEFINYLRNYLMDLPYADKPTRYANSLYWNNPSEFWDNFVRFFADIVETSPNLALMRCRALIDSITKTCLECLKEMHGFVLSEDNVLKLNEIRQKMVTYGDRYKTEGRRMLIRDGIQDEQMQQPPENFRELSVVPTKDDLLGSTPFLRPNIVEGGYQDVEHYLDVQFRLLREDCFGPFRDGLHQFLANPNKKKYDHVRIFHNVRFLCPYVDNLKVGAIVQVDMKTHKNFHKINWGHNKRFLFGSLVLFTKDHCSSFMAATILHRDVNLLSTGKIPVSVIDTNLDNSIYNGDKYTMIESEVYFEPYYHVLKALQEPSFPQHLAMQQYIVKVDAASTHPAYLSNNTDFIIYKDKDLNEIEELADLIDDIDIDSELNINKNHIDLKFKVLQPETWPTADELKFNESQYEAYRLALTHEFAVIQGPPGTGKTFIGIKVAKTLLQNVESNGLCLMLIICYTNHALDQFLEAISKITRSIVRIGGQSRNKAMEQFNLTNLRKTLTPALRATHSFFIDQKNQLRNSIQSLQIALKTLDIANNGVLSYIFLRNEGDYPVLQSLALYYNKMGYKVEDPLEYWLFEIVLVHESEYEREFDDCLLEYNNLLNTEEDFDERRAEMSLDDEKAVHDQKVLDVVVGNKASFLVSDARAQIKKLVSAFNQTTDFNERYQLQRAIQGLDARINLFNDMATDRDLEVDLQIHATTDFSLIPVRRRWAMYFTWTRHIIDELKEEIATLQESVAPSIAAYDEARMMMDLQLLKNQRVKVVGMTTSGAARMRKLLQAIAPKIVIVEEAAEVLEQHIITSLTKDCQHFILIGDHQQLRPSASHIKLAKKYNIEVSLFERMITNGMHSRRLNVQHRMRPEIAALISPHIYPDLANHPSVEGFKNVPGIEKNLYFFTHDYREEAQVESNSKANHKEADMALALANYLMQQGYTSDDITILAAYSGQMFYMRKERQNYSGLKHVQITVVDNYQGEESKIIILSLVRNNEENKIGFLGTDNRVCVALSRAKEGFYIFGNINMLKTAKSDLWSKIATTLENNGSLGTTLILKCQNHPDQVTRISTPEDFNKLPPEGGCYEKCNYQYHCGHKCQLYCHGYDREHINTLCTMKCERVLCDLDHVCPLKCSVDCQPCKVLVKKTLPCGHDMNVYCHRDPEDPKNKCLTKVEVTLPNCGHKTQKDCYQDIKKVRCFTPCVYRLEECGHVCSRFCHVTDDPNHEQYQCNKPCARAKAGCVADLIGDRGDHQCRKTCSEKCENCNVQVKKKRSNCKHSVTVACSKSPDDIPCNKNCARTMPCGHFCKKKCCEPCGDCRQMVEKVIPECNHVIKLQCKETPSHDMCQEKCTRLLSCGHPCTDRCGAVCDRTKCTKPVSAEVLSPCGHKIKLPCNVSALMVKGEVKSEQLAQYCSAACGAVLACKHLCAGTCASCAQGRLHQPCTQKCNQDNICGHQCQEPCNQICPPCKMPCEVRCKHSQCKRLCGEPCTPCQENCSRRCPHGACSRRCGEPCDRQPCDERCPRRRPCGHMCRGLCGEPCPDICQVCNPDDFPTDFLGDQYEETDKFIVLQDCNHIMEVDSMDSLMTGDQENIQIRKCPYCRKAIINTNRYKDTVNKMFKNDINPIKLRVYGTDKAIQMKLVELRRNVARFAAVYAMYLEAYMNTMFSNFTLLLKTQKKVSLLQVEMECVYLNILEMIAECWKNYRTQKPPITTLNDELQKHIKTLLGVLKIKPKSKIPIKISEQQQNDVGNEIKRLNVMVQLSKLLHLANSVRSEPKLTRQIETTKGVVFSLSVFNEDKAVESLKQLQEVIKISNTVVTKYEREMVVKAMGFKAGHWYKCPNGHYYCIGDCGRANGLGKCPDCGATVGGQSYVLTAGNSRATELERM
ncbi:hypothetical protein PYW08_004400 [Mythimna loreyi]|uniref:Uncharacterized protein n=1 Tax=Mythimna loreyi TaxID=667449 RepID=A0ACC2QSX2_9NEOP|nr:hypothetical protein PYW08_004400 [Mythimna loreyi]